MTNREMMRIVTYWGYIFYYSIDQDGDIDQIFKIYGPQIQHNFSDDSGGTVSERIQFGYDRVYSRVRYRMGGWGMVKDYKNVR